MKVTQQGNLNTGVVWILAGMEGYTLYSFELNFCMKFQFPKYDLIVTFNRSVRTTSFQLNYVVG